MNPLKKIFIICSILMIGALFFGTGKSVLQAQAGDPPDTPNEPNDVVHADDAIITGSLCVGFDCLTDGTESFGFDTIKLKENNLRLYLDDTSATAGFPANDWRFTFNDSGSGGANYFAVEDATGGKVPFRIIAGAPNHSLYVTASGSIGLGTTNPTYSVELSRTGTDAAYFANRTDGAQGVLKAGASSFQIGSASAHNVEMLVNNTPVMTLTAQGNATLQGALSEYSDANAKEHLSPVSGEDVLGLVAQLPIMTWNYKSDANEVRHIGPMAQDFYAAFGVGSDNLHIAALDANGVALSAIQALAKTNTEQQATIQQLKAENASLERRLASLEGRVDRLTSQSSEGNAASQVLAGAVIVVALGLSVFYRRSR